MSILSGRVIAGQHVCVDADRVRALRELLDNTGLVARTRDFAGSLRRSTRQPGDLLLVGTPDDEPWHLAAHLDDESRLAGVPELSPTLVRHAPPPDAPPHLSIGLQRIEEARRGETLFVVAPHESPEQLLERVADARRSGATILAMDGGDDDLASLAHDRLVVVEHELVVPSGVDVDFDTVQHLVSVAAGESVTRVSVRDKLSRFLERVSGPAPQR